MHVSKEWNKRTKNPFGTKDGPSESGRSPSIGRSYTIHSDKIPIGPEQKNEREISIARPLKSCTSLLTSLTNKSFNPVPLSWRTNPRKHFLIVYGRNSCVEGTASSRTLRFLFRHLLLLALA